MSVLHVDIMIHELSNRVFVYPNQNPDLINYTFRSFIMLLSSSDSDNMSSLYNQNT